MVSPLGTNGCQTGDQVTQMKVLHTVGSLFSYTGGPARSVPGLAGALCKWDMDVHLWSPQIPENYHPPQGVTLHRGNLDDVALLPGLDLIHDHGLWLASNHAVAKAALRRSVPRVVSPRGMLEPWALNHKKWKKKLAWLLYQRGDLRGASALHATAKTEADQFRQLGLKNPIHIIPNGVDVVGLEWGRTWHGTERIALFLSRMHPKKGLPLLVEAWAEVRPKGWKMRVVGPDEGGHRREVERMVEAAGLSSQWEFFDSMDHAEKHKTFASAHLFILPTFSENFGIVIAEALASGIPVITTTGAPWEELVTRGCGWWVPPEVSLLSEALREATECPIEHLREMGQFGKQWMESAFTWSKIAWEMKNIYEQIAR